MSITSRVSFVAVFMCAVFVASFAYAVEPYSDCTAGYNCTGQTTQTTTSTTQEPYAICIQQKVAAGMSQSAASAACATPAPTYSAAYTACVAQAGLLPASEQEVAKGACMTQHGSATSPSLPGTYAACLEQLAVLGLGSDATAATCRQMYPDSQTTVTTTNTNTNTQTTTPTVASLLAQLAQIQAIIVQLTGASSSGSCEAFSGLSRGMSGEAVTRAQNILITQGHLAAGNNTGFFGSLTEAAVQAFQAAKGIVSSGSPDTTGWGRIGPRTGLAMGLCS